MFHSLDMPDLRAISMALPVMRPRSFRRLQFAACGLAEIASVGLRNSGLRLSIKVIRARYASRRVKQKTAVAMATAPGARIGFMGRTCVHLFQNARLLAFLATNRPSPPHGRLARAAVVSYR